MSLGLRIDAEKLNHVKSNENNHEASSGEENELQSQQKLLSKSWNNLEARRKKLTRR